MRGRGTHVRRTSGSHRPTLVFFIIIITITCRQIIKSLISSSVESKTVLDEVITYKKHHPFPKTYARLNKNADIFVGVLAPNLYLVYN